MDLSLSINEGYFDVGEAFSSRVCTKRTSMMSFILIDGFIPRRIAKNS